MNFPFYHNLIVIKILFEDFKKSTFAKGNNNLKLKLDLIFTVTFLAGTYNLLLISLN